MSILSTIMGVESGGRNVTQGNIGDVNNRTGDLAQGYFQITGATWSDFGGNATGYTSAKGAPYNIQEQVAENIPVSRWGPATQNALAAAGYSYSPGETLGQFMSANGETSSGSPASDYNANGANIAPNGNGGMISVGNASPSDAAALNGSTGSGSFVTSSGSGAGVAGGGDTFKLTGTSTPSDWTTTGVDAVSQGAAGIGNSISAGIASAGSSMTTWLGAELDTAKNLALRLFLGLLAILLIVAALFFMSPMGREITPEVRP